MDTATDYLQTSGLTECSMQCWMKGDQCQEFNYYDSPSVQQMGSSSAAAVPNCQLFNFLPAKFEYRDHCQHYVVRIVKYSLLSPLQVGETRPRNMHDARTTIYFPRPCVNGFKLPPPALTQHNLSRIDHTRFRHQLLYITYYHRSTRRVAAGCGRHGMPPPVSNDTGTALVQDS